MRKHILSASILTAIVGSQSALATNGMNLEGIGAVSAGMGGTGIAFDHGSAGMMLNPATLALMPNESNRIDIGFTQLRPNVNAEVNMGGMTMDNDSEATAFNMPAAGWVMKHGRLAYGFGGVGLFPQGGMGTQYPHNAWLGNPCMSNADIRASMSGSQVDCGATSGLQQRSEVGVARFLLPVALEVNDQLSVGGSLDVVYASMDLRMSMSEAQFQDLMPGMPNTLGRAGGSLVNAFGMMYGPNGPIKQVHNAYFDFSNHNPSQGEADAWGIAGKLGVVYKVNSNLTLGATYHTQTALSDLEADDATMSMRVKADTGFMTTGVPNGVNADMNVPLRGTIRVKDFEWPSMFGVGMSYKATDKLMLAADVKWIPWSDVMEKMKMSFVADNSPNNGGFAGMQMDAALNQNWDDQWVYGIGLSYALTPQWTLRTGFNYGKNPVPDETLNPLFPAIVEKHLTAGVGYQWSPAHSVDFSIAKAFNVEQTNPGLAPNAATGGVGSPPYTVSHDQISWSLLYSYRF